MTWTPPLQPPLVVYCAASVEPAVRPISAAYFRATGRPVKLEVGPSGPLAEKLKKAGGGDLYIPAAARPFIDRAEQSGVVVKRVPLAALKLVLATRPESAAVTLQDIVDCNTHYVLAHEESAAGLATLEALAPLGDWPTIAAEAAAILPTVSDVAAAVRDGEVPDCGMAWDATAEQFAKVAATAAYNGATADCGIIWDATARQFGLAVSEVPEFESVRATIAAGILASSRDPAAAEELADYLAASSDYFTLLGYGDVS